MNVSCSSCNTQYKIDATKVPASGGFIKCKTCGERVKIPPPASVAEAATAPAPPADNAAPPIALAGSDTAPPTPAATKAIPLAGTAPSAPPPIPTAPAAPTVPATGAIPLAGTPDDEAPTVVTTTPTATPLAETPGDEAPTVVASTPSLPRTEAAIPLGESPAPVDDEAPTVVASTPSLPRTESSPVPDDEAPTAIGPAPSAPLDQLPSDDEAPTQISETPKFLDNVPPTSAPEDLPAALSTDETAALLEPTDGGATQPEATGLDSGLFDDLPTASVGEVTDGPSLDLSDDLPTPDSAPAFDDLPMAETGAPSLMDDLPAEVPSVPEDLPTEAPSLMDDLPTREGDTAVSGIDGAAMSAPELMLDEPLAEDQSSAPAIHPADLGMPPGEAATEEPVSPPQSVDATPPAKGKGRLIGIAAGGALVVLLAAVALTTPYLGVQIADPLGLAEKPKPDPQPQAKTKAKTKAKSKTKTKPAEPEPEPELVELSGDNVDTLGYAALRESTAVLAAKADDADKDTQGLLAWARFRLAASYGDEEARQALVAGLPKRPQEITKLNGLSAAAAIGGLALGGKAGPARKIGERMLKGRFKDSAHLALALSSAYNKRPEIPKALRHIDRARKLEPNLPDAALRRAQLMLAGKEPLAGAKALVALATAVDDPDLAVLAAGSLLAAQQTDRIAEVAAKLTDPAQVEEIAPQRRDLAWQLLCHQAIHSGDLGKALELATKRTEANSELPARIVLARLTTATGGDGDAVLEPMAEKLDNPADAAHLLAERVRLTLRKGDVEAAKKVLAQGDALRGKKTAGWLKLADGWLALRTEQAAAAKTAFTAAAKKKLPEARLEVALLADDKPGPLLKKLSELEKKTGLSAASYHLARVMKARGNARGAAQLLTQVLWTEPTVIDPTDLVLEWANAAAQAGDAELAMSTVTAVRDKQPDNVRPVLALIELKRRAGEHDQVVELYRALVKAKPKDSSLQVGLAAALNRAGSHSQAQGLLDDLFKTDKKARTPEALVELARAWAEREPYRARQLVKESIDSEATAEKFMLLGLLAEKRDQIDEARKAYARALELDDGFVDAHVALAHIDLQTRAYADVVTGLEKVLLEIPNHREAATILGDVYVEISKPREAIKRYEIALSTGDDEKLLMKVARLQLQRLGQLPPAIKTLRRLIAINPKIAEAYFHLAMAQKDQGQTRDAIANLKQCVALEPEGDWADEAKRTLQDLQK